MTESLPGLYLHVPFCRAKCPYCDFYSLAAPRLIPAWFEGLTREIELSRRHWGTFDSLYIGGGTPSSLQTHDLTSLVRLVFSSFDFTSGTEATVEVNPEDADLDKFKSLIGAGLNRVSIGVQSFDDAELRAIGRRHSAAEAVKAVEAARRAGCGNLGLDLMYGLPHQTEDKWIENLEKAVALEPEHLSCYQLTLEEGARFMRLFQQGRLALPDENLSRRLFLLTSEFLTARGYIHYEVSNFARGLEWRSRHNLKYWQHAPYLGLGPSAHSFRDNRRWWNHRSVRRYCDSLAQGLLPLAGEETLTDKQIHLERVFLGLRTREGVEAKMIEPEHILRLRQDSLAALENGRLVLTPEGLVLADRLAVMLSDRP